jgi:hypothetical protein
MIWKHKKNFKLYYHVCIHIEETILVKLYYNSTRSTLIYGIIQNKNINCRNRGMHELKLSGPLSSLE